MNGINVTSPTVAKGSEIDVSKLTIQKTSSPGTLKAPEELVFGRNFTGLRP